MTATIVGENFEIVGNAVEDKTYCEKGLETNLWNLVPNGFYIADNWNFILN